MNVEELSRAPAMLLPCGRSVDLERMRKLEIQDVRRIRKETNYLNLPFGLLECSNN